MMDKRKRFDETISKWLEEAAPARLPERVLDATFERTRRTRQRSAWRALLGKPRIQAFAPALGGAIVVVLVVGLAVSFYLNGRDLVGPAPMRLPTSVSDWSRVAVGSRFQTAQLDTFAASPAGVLALVGELGSDAFQLAIAPNGDDWSPVPGNQAPALEGNHVGLSGTDQGFLMLVDNDLWSSADGLSWDGLAGSVTDLDLSQGKVLAVAAGGPGYVAVGGNNKAWYSTNGAEWSLAQVPALPGPEDNVAMQGVASRGDTLVAWGFAEVAEAGSGDETSVRPVLWYSTDGISWASAEDLQADHVTAVTGGPHGFVAIGVDVPDAANEIYTAWLSDDGRTWQRGDVLTSTDDEGAPVPATVKSIAATDAGYVAVGANYQCFFYQCLSISESSPPMQAVLWTSPDGRSWSRLPNDDPFVVSEPGATRENRGSDATTVAAWGSHFVVGGHYDSKPVIWISGQERSGTTQPPSPEPTAAPSSAPTLPPEPGAFLGTWTSTSDGDSGLQTMTVTQGSDGTVEVVVTDTIASVCSATSSTMTGTGSIDGNSLVIATPDYRCDDGSEPRLLNGDATPLNEFLRNLTYVYDPESDTLSIGDGLWVREEGQ